MAELAYPDEQTLSWMKQIVIQDITQQYHGLPNNTRLEVALKGSMSTMASVEERNRIIAWIHRGATMDGFPAVAPIFKNNCAVCHNPQRPLARPHVEAPSSPGPGASPFIRI